MATNFEIPSRSEFSYRRDIFKLISREIPTGLNRSNVDQWLERFASVSLDKNFIKVSDSIALKMTKDINSHNILQWKEVSRKATGGSRVIKSLHEANKNRIGQAIKDQSQISSDYISSMPYRIAQKMINEVQIIRDKGATEQGVVNILRRRITSSLASRIKLIARSDPSRTNSAFTKARSEDFHLNCFIWTTVRDSLVRYSHEKMDGVLVFWDDLPSPELLIGLSPTLGFYAPGDCPGCRCTAIPVISIGDLFNSVNSTIKVYTNDSIKRLSKSQLTKLIDRRL